MTAAMAGVEPATVGLRSNPRLHHRQNSFYISSPGYKRCGTGIAACRRPKSYGPK